MFSKLYHLFEFYRNQYPDIKIKSVSKPLDFYLSIELSYIANNEVMHRKQIFDMLRYNEDEIIFMFNEMMYDFLSDLGRIERRTF